MWPKAVSLRTTFHLASGALDANSLLLLSTIEHEDCPGGWLLKPESLHCNKLIFLSRYQLQIVSWGEVGLHVYFSSSVLGFFGRLYACCHRLCMFICASGLFGLEMLCPWRRPLSQALTIFLPPLQHRCMSLEGRGKINISQRSGYSKPLTLYTLSSSEHLC